MKLVHYLQVYIFSNLLADDGKLH